MKFYPRAAAVSWFLCMRNVKFDCQTQMSFTETDPAPSYGITQRIVETWQMKWNRATWIISIQSLRLHDTSETVFMLINLTSPHGRGTCLVADREKTFLIVACASIDTVRPNLNEIASPAPRRWKKSHLKPSISRLTPDYSRSHLRQKRTPAICLVLARSRGSDSTPVSRYRAWKLVSCHHELRKRYSRSFAAPKQMKNDKNKWNHGSWKIVPPRIQKLACEHLGSRNHGITE